MQSHLKVTCPALEVNLTPFWRVRTCILENEGVKDAEVIECLKDVKPRFAVIGAPT